MRNPTRRSRKIGRTQGGRVQDGKAWEKESRAPRYDDVAREFDKIDARNQLDEYLKNRWAHTDLTPADAVQIDLNEYVRSTGAITMPAGERLRRLAIFIEDKIVHDESPKESLASWKSLDRIYQEAIRLSDAPAEICHSRAVTALTLSEQNETSDSGKLWTIAVQSAREAASHDPTDSDYQYFVGLCLYVGEKPLTERPADLKETLDCLRTALDLDPTHSLARLYLAHIHHDQENWKAAAEEYEKVRPDRLPRYQMWRYELLLEQRAYCLMKAGQLDEAIAGFEEVIARRQRAIGRGEKVWESDALFQPAYFLAEAAQGELRDALFEKASKVAKLDSVADAEGEPQ